MNKYIMLAGLLIFLMSACQSPKGPASKEKSRVDIEALKVNALQAAEGEGSPVVIDDYWRQGKAELNRYKLKQNRYRDVHEGEAVLVFVLEDFLYQKQVKNDYYRDPNSTAILKTNKLIRFPTGLYDYSMMTSTFTPVDASAFPNTLKISHTGQDWCGQVFSQLNRTNSGYKLSSFSYFESEGDESREVKGSWVEDEFFNRIRLNPESLPIGEHKVIPSSDVLRFLHLEFKAYQAEITRKPYEESEFEGEALTTVSIKYPTLKRELAITYENKAPYEIVGWTDTYPSVFDRKPRKTIAKRTNKLFTDYWSKNKLGDQKMRADFGLETYLK
ncbi:MAG: hypothetical protein MRZ79_23800 [Bacteroidia bacterium]|nr:hypothetical protein [Bacteroidia bacterium]